MHFNVQSEGSISQLWETVVQGQLSRIRHLMLIFVTQWFSGLMGVEFQKKVGGIFSNNVQGHLEVIEGHEFRHLTDFINNAYNED